MINEIKYYLKNYGTTNFFIDTIIVNYSEIKNIKATFGFSIKKLAQILNLKKIVIIYDKWYFVIFDNNMNKIVKLIKYESWSDWQRITKKCHGCPLKPEMKIISDYVKFYLEENKNIFEKNKLMR